jgi:hypothetical protein
MTKEKILDILRNGFLFEVEEVLKLRCRISKISNDGFIVKHKGKSFLISIKEE